MEDEYGSINQSNLYTRFVLPKPVTSLRGPSLVPGLLQRNEAMVVSVWQVCLIFACSEMEHQFSRS